MNCYIKELFVFDQAGEKRPISFTPGVNIITGESKTGKSALIEIVDYCLTSKRSNIPQGVISNFGYLYGIILAFPNKYLIIGRKAFLEGGNKKMYIAVETSPQIIQDIQLSYFERLQPELVDNVRLEIARHFRMAIMDMTESYDADKNRGKASLRNITPFLFQHQNLIANKHALFYRFDDFYYRKNTIEEFPVFAGWTTDEYYLLKRQLEDKRKELRQVELSIKKKKQAQQDSEQELRGYFKNYYALLGKPFDESLSFEELLRLRDQLPDYESKTFVSQDIRLRYDRLKQERDAKYHQLNQNSVKIKNLEETQRYANDYEINLRVLEKTSQYSDNIPTTVICPLCGKENDDLSQQAQQLQESRTKLAEELSQVGTYGISYTHEIDELSRQQTQIRNELRILNAHIEDIKQTIQEIEKQEKVENALVYAKAKIDIKALEFEKEKNIRITDTTEELKGEIEILEQKLSKFNLRNLIKRTESFLNQSMSNICEKLDFEEELRPANLWFKLENFTLSHQDKKLGKISINEMGSGANWLACHLSLFLTFLHVFAKEEYSTVPSFLLLDQPSQVYFPNEFDPTKDKEVQQVANIYKTILDKVAEIEQDCGYAPQVIVTDHADKLDLEVYSFESFVRKLWRDGEKLI